MKLSEILEQYRPGSRDWNWEAEFKEIDERLFSSPITLGTDGRVVDGHHRLRLAAALYKDCDLLVDFVDMSEPVTCSHGFPRPHYITKWPFSAWAWVEECEG